MTLGRRELWFFIFAVVLANVLTIFASALVFRMAPQLRHHHPGFQD